MCKDNVFILVLITYEYCFKKKYLININYNLKYKDMILIIKDY